MLGREMPLHGLEWHYSGNLTDSRTKSSDLVSQVSFDQASDGNNRVATGGYSSMRFGGPTYGCLACQFHIEVTSSHTLWCLAS